MKEERKPQIDGKQSKSIDKTKPIMGRPVEPVPEDHAERICSWISEGNTLRAYCREHNIHFSTVYDWIEKDDNFARRFAKSRDTGHDCIAEETMEIIDAVPERILNAGGGDRIDPGYVQWKRNQADQRLKLLAKWNPKKYGDKTGLNLPGNISLQVITGVPSNDL